VVLAGLDHFWASLAVSASRALPAPGSRRRYRGGGLVLFIILLVRLRGYSGADETFVEVFYWLWRLLRFSHYPA
jgi:hypothetical protein